MIVAWASERASRAIGHPYSFTDYPGTTKVGYTPAAAPVGSWGRRPRVCAVSGAWMRAQSPEMHMVQLRSTWNWSVSRLLTVWVAWRKWLIAWVRAWGNGAE